MTEQQKNAVQDFIEFIVKLLPLAFLVWGAGAFYTRIMSLEEWRRATQENMFTASDGEVLEKALRAEIDRLEIELHAELRTERAFIRQLCNDLSRLYQQGGQIPPNDCGRP